MSSRSRLTRPTAIAVLLALVVLLVLGVTSRVPEQPGGTNAEQGDAAMFRKVAVRMQAGQSYYAAMGAELRLFGYPTASVFNWRTPLPLVVYAAMPTASSLILLGLGILAVLATVILVRNAPPETTLVAVILQVGAAASIVLLSGSATIAEIWTSYFVFGSILAYHTGRFQAGAILGIVALFVRELAAPYCVAAGVIAMIHRRRAEVLVWVAGAVAYAIYFAFHVSAVVANMGADAVSQPGSWVQFGGVPFVLGTMSFNGWFAASKPWGPSIGLVLVMASPWARSAPLHLRVCCVLYVAFFAVVGQPFNQNWGLLVAPTWALACGYGLAGVLRLIRVARGRVSG